MVIGQSRSNDLPVHSIVMVGSGGVGKSSLTLRFIFGEFTDSYDPTKAESYRKRLEVIDPKSGRETDSFEVDILDTAGQESYAAIRDNYYRSGDGFVIVFSVTDRQSFRACINFYEQIKRATNDPSPSVILVGNKSDLDRIRQVGYIEGEMLADKWGNCIYRETSARLNEGVDRAFEEVLYKVIKRKEEREAARQDQLAKKKRLQDSWDRFNRSTGKKRRFCCLQ